MRGVIRLVDGPEAGRSFEVPLPVSGQPSTDWAVSGGAGYLIFAYQLQAQAPDGTFEYRFLREDTARVLNRGNGPV